MKGQFPTFSYPFYRIFVPSRVDAAYDSSAIVLLLEYALLLDFVGFCCLARYKDTYRQYHSISQRMFAVASAISAFPAFHDCETVATSQKAKLGSRLRQSNLTPKISQDVATYHDHIVNTTRTLCCCARLPERTKQFDLTHAPDLLDRLAFFNQHAIRSIRVCISSTSFALCRWSWGRAAARTTGPIQCRSSSYRCVTDFLLTHTSSASSLDCEA